MPLGEVEELVLRMAELNPAAASELLDWDEADREAAYQEYLRQQHEERLRRLRVQGAAVLYGRAAHSLRHADFGYPKE